MPKVDHCNIDKLINTCLNLGINIVFPSRDGELLFWAENANKFRRNGIEVLISKSDSIKICLDKLLFSEFGIKENLPIIPSYLSPKNLKNKKIVVKERFGSGSKSIGINLDIHKANLHQKKLKNPIFQPFIKGDEISVDAWLSKSCKVKGLILRRRDIIHNGESQITTTFRDLILEKKIESILNQCNLQGAVVLQAIIGEDNSFNIIECNPRFGGASTISIKAGLDLLRWSILEISGEKIENYPFNRTKNEIRQIRIPSDIHIYDSNF